MALDSLIHSFCVAHMSVHFILYSVARSCSLVLMTVMYMCMQLHVWHVHLLRFALQCHAFLQHSVLLTILARDSELGIYSCDIRGSQT